VRLLLVGGSLYRRARADEIGLRTLARSLGLERHVAFAGIRSPSEVAAAMRESALLVLPSRRETFGSVLVEALASGTPVVATRCGGPEDVVTDGVGRLVPPEDPEALAEAMEDVLRHRARYAPAALRAYALEHFAWERVGERTVALYDQAR
jgi:glycosyltransferase involved in cell wall biosynthesis